MRRPWFDPAIRVNNIQDLITHKRHYVFNNDKTVIYYIILYYIILYYIILYYSENNTKIQVYDWAKYRLVDVLYIDTAVI